MARTSHKRVSLLEPGRDPKDPFEIHGIGDYHFRIEGRVVRWVGPTFDRPGRLIPLDHAPGPYLVVKIPGGKVWTGVGYPWKYYPTRIYVFRILHERPAWRGDRSVLNPDARDIIAERVLSFAVRA